MTDIDTLLARPPLTARVNPLAQAALDALDERRAMGWRPGARTDWPAPQNVTCLGNPIDKDATAKAIAEHGFTEDEIAQINADVEAWTATHQEAKTDAPLAGPPTGGTTTPTEATPMETDTTIHAHPQRRPPHIPPVNVKDKVTGGNTMTNQPAEKIDEYEAHEPNRYKLFFAWWNNECTLRELTDATDKNNIRKRIARIAGNVDSFTELPDSVTWEHLKAIALDILRVEYTRKPTKEAWINWLRARGYTSDYIIPILSAAQQKAGGKPVEKLSEYNGELSDAERDIVAFQANASKNGDMPKTEPTTPAPATERESEPAPQTKTTTPATPKIPRGERPSVDGERPSVDGERPSVDGSGNVELSDKGAEQTKAEWTFKPTLFLKEVTTLTGCPVGELYTWLNKRHNKKYYKEIPAKDRSDKWTDLDPVAVRKRFDKVFGPQGFGWRILPLDHANAQTFWTPGVQKTKNGERDIVTATSTLFVFEYAVVIAGQMVWQRTSAFSDANINDDPGDALRGASTSLMKQALKMFGGYDHFIDKAA